MNRSLLVTAALMLLMVFTTNCKKPQEPSEDDNITPITPEYVDLGLPSGTLWATFNVGANAPEELGYFYAWGETQPKTTYRWNTYKYCHAGDSTQLTKYCDEAEFGYNGYTDTLGTLVASDDPATVVWGSEWCTPTYAQWKELFDCEQDWIFVNGVAGKKIMGANGKSIFLPATGFRGINDDGETHGEGYYWSSTLSPYIPALFVGEPYESLGYHFALGGLVCYMSDYERYNGFAVRPVRTKDGNNDVPEEQPIIGLFSINDSTQVCFSPGNLQYQASTHTWRFAEHQWDYIGEGNANISETYDGWIDLFGWGRGDNPTYSSTLTYDSVYNTFVDWGENVISNWNGVDCRWRTMELMDWRYLLSYRNTDSGIRYVAATVNGVKGLILLPDQWDTTVFTFVGYNHNGSTFDSNMITAPQWETIERHGAIFLPAAGVRRGTVVERIQEDGLYWIAGPNDPWAYVFYVEFYNGSPGVANYCPRYAGLSVRLVRDADGLKGQKQSAQGNALGKRD